MKADIKKFYLGALLGVVVAYIPKMMSTTASIGTAIYWIPNKLAEVMKLTTTDGFGKFILVGDPTLFAVTVWALIGGIALMFMKK